MIHHELSERIIGCAMTVHNKLKPGLREKTYERALIIELGKSELKIDQQKQYNVTYDDIIIDTFIPDLVVADSVIVDAKCVDSFADTHIAQMAGYLTITKLRIALLINFKHARLQWKRVVK